MARDFKRTLIISDTHCGHETGLTPPKYDPEYPEGTIDIPRNIRRTTWNWFTETVEKYQPIDILLANADLIDGRGEKSGSNELITTNRYRQAKMAIDIIKFIGAPKIVMSRGTPYHTGKEEDFEEIIADEVEAFEFRNAGQFEVNGLVFDYKHHISRSSIPHGRFTAAARERLWNVLKEKEGSAHGAHVFVRSHVHYHTHLGEHGWLAMTTPALQWSSDYGEQTKGDIVHFGFIIFDIYELGDYTWKSEILDPVVLVPELVSL